MKLTKFLSIFILLTTIGFVLPMSAQVKGGRMKEHRNQRGGGFKLFGPKARGNANSFAKGGRKRSLLARIFNSKKSGSDWVYKKTNPGFKQNKEQSHLFSRNRTSHKRFSDGVLSRQNKKRSSNRVRGSSSFSKKKH